MSAAEVIEQIKKLPSEEQQKMPAFVHAAENAGALQKPGAKVTEAFRRVADEMFSTNAGLFRKFAPITVDEPGFLTLQEVFAD